MKVTTTNETVAQAIQQYKVSGGVKQGSKSSGVLSQQEQVDLSSEVKGFQQIKKAIDDLPDIREEKVQGLKKQIQEGTYSVSGEKIAEKMLGEALLDIFA